MLNSSIPFSTLCHSAWFSVFLLYICFALQGSATRNISQRPHLSHSMHGTMPVAVSLYRVRQCHLLARICTHAKRIRAMMMTGDGMIEVTVSGFVNRCEAATALHNAVTDAVCVCVRGTPEPQTGCAYSCFPFINNNINIHKALRVNTKCGIIQTDKQRKLSERSSSNRYIFCLLLC